MRLSLAIAIAMLAAACSGGGPGNGAATVSETANRAPVATNDNAQTRAGTSKLIDVLVNDFDPDGDVVSLTTIQQPVNGIAYIDPGLTASPIDDRIVYTPGDGFSGQESISYSISDDNNGRASGLLSINVLPPPDPVNTPKADSGTTTPNTPLNLPVLLNDIWDGSSPLAIAGVSNAISGVVTIQDNGTTATDDDYLRYTPAPGFVGTDSFIYELTSGSRAVVHVLVNPDPTTPIGAIVDGSIMKGPVHDAMIRFYAIDTDGNRSGSAIAQTVSDDTGQFSAFLPLPRTDLLAVSFGGYFVDETDSQPDPSLRRIITFAPGEGLSSIVPASASYVAINAYTDSLLRQAVRTADPGQFAARYMALKDEFGNAIGFDLVTTVPANPDAPDPTTSIAARQYAMALGGIASALNRIALAFQQNAMTYSVVSGLVDDLSRCLLNGVNESGTVAVLLNGLAVPLPADIDLNREILRFRNNRNNEYQTTPLLQINRQGCDGDTPPPPLPDENSSPTGLSLDTANINENAPSGTMIGTFATTDIDPDDSHVITLVAGVGSTGNSNFTITGGQLFSNVVFDFETQTSYSIRVRTDDLVSVPFEKIFIITVNDLNESPTLISLDTSTIDENRSINTVVGTLTVADDNGDTHNFTLVAGPGDTGNAAFSIVGDQLHSNAVFNYEAQSTFSIRVRADDMVSAPLEEILVISVLDVNEAPTALTLDQIFIDENLGAGTVVGMLTTADEDVSDTHTYTLVAGVGDTGNSSFSIVGDQLVSSVVFNFESQNSYSIRLGSDDSVTTPIERNFLITINDVNDPPSVVSLDTSNIDENLAVGTVIGTFTTTDDDPGDSHTYTLVAGTGDTGNSSFSIAGDQLVSSVVFDFENQNSFSIRLRSDDSVSTPIERNFTITINDLNDPPTAISLDTSNIDENLTAGTVVGTLTTTDDDSGDSHTYTLVAGAGDTGNGSFSIVGDQLVSSVVFDFETQNSYSIRLSSDDSVTTPIERNFIITVNDLNEQPTAISLDNSNIDENLAAGTVIGTFTTTDDDPGDSHTYTLVAGAGDTGNGSFSIVGDQLLSNAMFDFETQNSYSIRLRSDDSVSTPIERNFTITVNDINEQPTAISLDTGDIDENLATGTVIGTFTTTDDDPGDSHTYTLVAGAGDTGNGSFSIVGDQLLSSVVFDFEAQSSYSIRLSSDDSVTTPIERNFTITVNDVNDPPTLTDDTIVTPVDGPAMIDVLANDNDQDGDPLTIVAVSSPTPAGGIATINDNATPADTSDDFIDYSPPAGYEGDDTFSYTVSDGLVSVAANITVSISDFGYVASVFPANGAQLVPIGQNIAIVFKQPMNASMLDNTTLVLSVSATGVPALTATVNYSPGSLTATIDPDSDLDAGTVYFVVISDLIENTLGQPQGFEVVTSFTVTPDPGDTDSDGLSDFEEATIGGCLDPTEPDSDFDGIGDGAEVSGGGDPCSDQGQTIYYVDDDGAAGGWATATTGFGGFSSGTASNPNYVLIAEGTYPDQIDYSTNCDYLVFAGSQDPAVPGRVIRNSDGSPTTIVDMALTRNSEFANCTDVTLRDIHLISGIGNTGKGGGIRVSGTTTALLESVWLTNNSTNDQGGGLGVSNFSVATVKNSVIKDNEVTGGKGGGGIWVGANARLDIENTLVMDNLALAAGGGGLYFDPLSTGTIVNTYIIANRTSGHGAGIFILNNDGAKDTIVNVADSVIAGNLASNNGGGIYIDGIGGGASLFGLQHNRIYDNRAALGAGIMLDSTGTIVTVLNNLILGNNAPSGGGGLYINNGIPQLRNNTIIYNLSAQPTGAAIAVAGAANPLIRDSIIWQNRAGGRPLSAAVMANDNYTAGVAQSDFNLLEVDKIGTSDIDFVNDGVTPGFDAGFYLDQLTSPAINTGSDTALFLTLDMRFTAAAGPTDAGTVDRGYHHPVAANYPADGYIENDGVADNSITVTNANTGLNSVPVIIRPLVAGIALGPGHYLVGSLEGVNTGLAQLVDQAGVDPLSDGESVILSDLGNGNYRAYIESESPAISATTIPLRIYIDGQTQPVVFEIDRLP